MDAASRLQLRLQEARPRLDALRVWLIQTRITVADGGATAKALDYSLKRWPALMRYADSGVLPIDNNPVHAASGMNRIMPTPGLCRVPHRTDTAVGRIPVSGHLRRHYQRLSRKASNGSGGL